MSLQKKNTHYAGFVGIIGMPNVGKSTLMELLLGEKISIISPKAQTTRHNILGMLNEEDSQTIFIDTPGLIQKPKYTLHHQMMTYVKQALKDLEVVLYMTTVFENPEIIAKQIEQIDLPIIIVINKIDLGKQRDIIDQVKFFEKYYTKHDVLIISALHDFGIHKLRELIKKKLPLHPPYYEKDTLTNRSLRFFISEIVREKIFLNYKKEIPYCSEVVIDMFKERNNLVYITGRIIVERESQKYIMVGKGGQKIKALSIAARKDIQDFLQKQIYLTLEVKVISKWREKRNMLKQFGYI